MMVWKRKRYWLLGLLSCIVALGGYWLSLKQVWGQVPEREYRDYRLVPPTTFETLPDGHFIFIDSAQDRMDLLARNWGSSYFVALEGHQMRKDSTQPSPPREPREWLQLLVYELNGDLSSPRKFDLYSFLDGEDASYYRLRVGAVVNYEGRDYFYMDFYRVFDKREHQYKEVLVDLETGQEAAPGTLEAFKAARELQRDPYLINIYNEFPRGDLVDSIVQQLRERYGIEVGSGAVLEGWEGANLSGTNFAQLYPEIAGQFKEGSVLYMRFSEWNAEEYLNNLLYWFAPAGEATLEVYAEDYDTKERTRITSYQEYQEWLNAHPNSW